MTRLGCVPALSQRWLSLPSQNTPLQVHTYNVLLHLCSGGNQQGEAATRVHPAESKEV